MKKIINGKVYNTDTATKIAEYENGSVTDGLHYYTETLYRKKTGEYFIHGEGGAATIYGKRASYDRWMSGERIYPIRYEEAKGWAEKHMDAESYIEEFGEIEEDQTKVVYSFNISKENLERLRRASQEAGKSMSSIIDDYIETL